MNDGVSEISCQDDRDKWTETHLVWTLLTHTHTMHTHTPANGYTR